MQRSKAQCRDEGHSLKNDLEPSAQGTKACPKPACPIPQQADIPQEPTPSEQMRTKKHPKPAVLEQPHGGRAGPGAPSQPSAGSLITGMEALTDRRQSPRRYHRNNPHPAQPSKGFVRVPVCAAPSPPPLFFLCVCVRVHEKELGFFLFPGKRLAPGLRPCEKQGQDRRTDRQMNQENQPP